MVFYPLSMPFSNCNSKVVTWRGSGKHHVEFPMVDTGDGWYIPTRWSICTLGLVSVIANAILIGNLLLHSLKGMLGSGGHNSVLGGRIVCLQPVIFEAMQCSFKPLPMTCCHPRGPMEVTIGGQWKLSYFIYFPWITGKPACQLNTLVSLLKHTLPSS